jgi:hypothetical protein
MLPIYTRPPSASETATAAVGGRARHLSCEPARQNRLYFRVISRTPLHPSSLTTRLWSFGQSREYLYFVCAMLLQAAAFTLSAKWRIVGASVGNGRQSENADK